jgi:hypothetical protein
MSLYNNLKRTTSIVPDRRGFFLELLYEISSSQRLMSLLKAFRIRLPNFEIGKDAGTSYRVINHWDSLGLIDCERASSNSWRRFNLIETLWISVMRRFRKMEISLGKIAQIKPYFFEIIDPKCPITIVDFYVMCAYLQARPVFFITLLDGQSEFLFYEEYKAAISSNLLDSCITIHINPFLKEVLPEKNIRSNFTYMFNPFVCEEPLPPICQDLLQMVEKEDFDFIQIVKRKGKIKEMHIEQNFPGSVKEHDLKQGYRNVSIENHHENGSIKGRKRTIHEKF